ncbi:SH3 domain-containing protein [Neobacillus niacini]|uniref:SH3 domain-containing protein n=1 Tax=Neobacillus niacini TaxID=86668 RepID=UPI00126A7A40|nr:SH3 domain-containing protein [Neobacillus niacini]
MRSWRRYWWYSHWLLGTSTDSSNNILTSVSNGTYLNLVTINGMPVTQNGWYQVFVPNSSTTGWVHGDYIKLVTN